MLAERLTPMTAFQSPDGTTWSPDVVTCGEAMVAFIADDGAPSAQAVTFRRSVVGSESNVAIGLARLGHGVSFVGRVGEDPEGTSVRRALRVEGVDTTAVTTDPDAPTGVLIRDRVLDRPVRVSYRRTGSAGSRLEASDLPEFEPAAPRIVHITGLTAALSGTAAEAVRELAQRGRNAGSHITFDPNLRLRLADIPRWQEIVAELLPLADDLLIGREEMALLGLDLGELREKVGGAVVVKDGRNGTTAYEAGEEVHLPIREVRVADPVGAGDAFAVGWIAGTLQGADLRRRTELGSLVASCVVAHPDDTTGYPDAAELAGLTSGPDVIR